MKEEIEEEEVEARGYLEILKMNQPEGLYIFVGCIFAGILGVAMPAFAILFSEVVAVSRSTYMCVGRNPLEISWYLCFGIHCKSCPMDMIFWLVDN